MAEINTVINIRDEEGNLIALNTRIKEVKPVASQPSIIDQITTQSGKGFYTGDIIKKVKRSQVDSTAAAAKGGVGGFKGASSQNVHKVFIEKKYREDNIIWNEIDLTKLSEAKNGNIVAMEAADFLITGRELDAKELIASLKTKATAAKLHTAFDANGKPTGNQPAQAGNTFAQAVTAIKAGKRVITLANFDEETNTRLELIREGVQYLNEMGTAANTESGYLFSINGNALSSIKILTRYRDAVKIKDKGTTNFINVNGSTMRNITGMIGYIDNLVEVLVTNQLPSTTKYAIVVDRALVRDLDQTTQYIGRVRDTGSVKMADNSVVNLKPNERLLQFMQGRSQGVVFWEEAFFLDQA